MGDGGCLLVGMFGVVIGGGCDVMCCSSLVVVDVMFLVRWCCVRMV